MCICLILKELNISWAITHGLALSLVNCGGRSSALWHLFTVLLNEAHVDIYLGKK